MQRASQVAHKESISVSATSGSRGKERGGGGGGGIPWPCGWPKQCIGNDNISEIWRQMAHKGQ